jgi:hypothetical protein
MGARKGRYLVDAQQHVAGLQIQPLRGGAVLRRVQRDAEARDSHQPHTEPLGG